MKNNFKYKLLKAKTKTNYKKHSGSYLSVIIPSGLHAFLPPRR